MHKIKIPRAPRAPRNNYLINPDINADSLHSAMLSTCHDGKNALLLVTKSHFPGKTNKFVVLASFVVILALFHVEKYMLSKSHIKNDIQWNI